MAIPEHLRIVRQGVEAWNRWREEHPEESPDLSEADLRHATLIRANLSGANLSGADLSEANLIRVDLRRANLRRADLSAAHLIRADLRGADLRGANFSRASLFGADLSRAFLSGADLSGAHLRRADLSEANLSGVHLRRADLRGAHLSGAHLSGAHLSGADLRRAHLRRADLSGADLSRASLFGADLSRASLFGAALVETNLTQATINGCGIYGVSAWNLRLEGAKQSDLVITPYGEPVITVDNLEVAQFVYLLLNNEKIRGVIDTITSTVVLILGRFTKERKTVLDAIRDELRRRSFTPMLFDFEKPSSKDLTETVSTLAHMARFVIADLTDARSVGHELQKIIPGLPSLPVQPIILASQHEYAMFQDFGGYLSVLPPYRYETAEKLLSSLEESVIEPALEKAEEIAERRRAFEAELGKGPKDGS